MVWRVLQALSLIEAGLNNSNLTADLLSQQLATSQRRLRQLFAAATGRLQSVISAISG